MRYCRLVILVSITALFLFFNGNAQKNIYRVLPKQNGKLYSIAIQNTILEIDPTIGGRITSFSIDGKNFLTDSTINNFNWGSTFWPSPQSEWNWPPSAEIDNKSYTVTFENNQVKMESKKDPKTGLVVTKKFSGNKKDGTYTLEYTFTNQSDSAQKVAPWEITRVKINGFTFFPMGKGERRGGLVPLVTEIDGICWFTYNLANLPKKGDRQLYTDGREGWMAEVNGDFILIKKFDDLPYEKAAPAEGEIELYTSPIVQNKGYVEIENQGAYVELEPGKSSTWKVNWYLKKLPPEIKAQAGNPKLVSYVRSLIK